MLLRAIKLPAFHWYGEDVAQKAEREGWSFGQYLLHLCELEIQERRRRRIERNQKDSELLVVLRTPKSGLEFRERTSTGSSSSPGVLITGAEFSQPTVSRKPRYDGGSLVPNWDSRLTRA
jgi:hypothetical protein